MVGLFELCFIRVIYSGLGLGNNIGPDRPVSFFFLLLFALVFIYNVDLGLLNDIKIYQVISYKHNIWPQHHKYPAAYGNRPRPTSKIFRHISLSSMMNGC